MKPISLFLFIILFLFSCTAKESKDEIKEELKRITVTVVEFKPVFSTIEFSQNISARREAMLSPATPGRIERILVEKGDSVSKGQLLVILSGEMLAQAQAQYEAAKSDYIRAQNLYENSAISLQQLERTEAVFKSASAQRDMSARAAYIYAPFKGIIAQISCEEGEVFTFTPEISLNGVKGGGIITLSAIDSVKVTGNIPERHYNAVFTGQEAYVSPDLFPDTVWTGYISNKGSFIDESSRTFEVQILIDNPGLTLKPGMFARVSIELEQRISAVIPEEALVTEDAKEGFFVFVIQNGMAQKRPVETASVENGFVEILLGINPGDTIAERGARTLQDGDKVQIITGE